MKLIDTNLPEVKRIARAVHADGRGYFSEYYHREKLAALGIELGLAQINHSRSHPGVIRGIHFQHSPAQGKLVSVTRGAVIDIAVDLRPHSPRFMQHVAVELSDDNAEMLWIPDGFGHAFCVIGEVEADLIYAVDAPYNAQGEAGVRFDDTQINIPWPIASPILSDRDRALPSVGDIIPQLTQWFPA